jgi:hypothetical protein
VALVDGLEECNFRIACEVDILSTVCHKLHHI